MLLLKALLLVTSILVPAFALDDKQSWKLSKQEDGIIVYTRKLAHSNYPEFRGETNINASIDELLKFIRNDKNCADWRYKCIEMQNLSDGYIYRLSHLPWPFNNRYTVMKSITYFNKRDNKYTVKLTNIQRDLLPQSVQAQLPDTKDNIQMRFSDGYWQFIPEPVNNSVHVIYQMHGDADADLPTELIQIGIINSAFVTLYNLKKHFNRVNN